MPKCKVDFDALQWESPVPGARYKAYRQGNHRLRLVEFAYGFVEPDWCINGHIGYVLDGEMAVDFGGDVVHFSAGDGVFIPPGVENRHRAYVSSDVVMLILVEEVACCVV
jgi:quercetin dioxygenase-like cupin family protein